MRRTAIALTTLAVLAGALGAAWGQPPADPRQRVTLPAAGRDKVLAEMRGMLEALHAILRGVAAGDLPQVEQAARKAGMATAADADPAVMGGLPLAFRQMGMQTHRLFDDLADLARAGGGRDEALRRLAVLTGNCVACHATYRLDEAR